jgi:Mg2+/Co2+ transporter CorB
MAAKFPREGGSSGQKPTPDLQELLKNLVLKDEELDDVILPREEFVNLRESARWMAVVKVLTTKHFGNQPFFPKMDIAWGFARKWSIRPVEENLFILQVSCLGD